MTIQPTAQQFTDIPRSKKLRALSLQLAEKLEATLGGGPEAQHKPDINKLIGQLQAMDIIPEIHVGKPQEVFSDPVIMAEYVAGQLLFSTDDPFTDLLVMRSVLNCVYRFLDAE